MVSIVAPRSPGVPPSAIAENHEAVLSFLVNLPGGFSVSRILPQLQEIDSRIVDRDYLAAMLEEYQLWDFVRERRSLVAVRRQGIPSSYHVADLILPPFEW